MLASSLPLLAVAAATQVVLAAPSTIDPCTKIAGVKWAAPTDVRACFESFPVNETLRANIVETASKLYAGFHTSTNVYVRAPPPFQNEVHVDYLAEFQRIAKQKYPSYFHFHRDIQDVIKLGRDGHASISNLCFDSVFVTYLPFPLVVLQSPLGSIGSIHIAPEASAVAATEFPDQIDFWKSVKGLSDLASFDGAKVLLIDGLDPWIAVDRNAAVQGSQQSTAQRQNGFFSSYTIASTGWTYSMGNFASRGIPILDKVTLTVLKKGAVLPTTVTVPYRSRLGTGITAWTDSASFFAGNCLARASTNGVDYYPGNNSLARIALPEPGREQYFAPPVAPQDRLRAQNTEGGSELLFDVELPQQLQPNPPTSGSGAMQFYLLDDNTGVLALGSFSGTYSVLETGLLEGLKDLRNRGATKLIVDLTNNGGGYICIANWLHRLIAGQSPKSEPLAGLNTTIRATPIARKIVDKISNEKSDPQDRLLYNPLGRKFANNSYIPEFYNWLTPGNPRVINGRQDAFGDTIGDDCQPFELEAPTEAIFDPKNVLLVNNGRCSSSCALFTIAMSVHYGTKSVVVGGKPLTKQQYCGTVGGQSTNYVTMDTQVKSTKLKTDPLAPPDLLSATSFGITWRLGYSIRQPTEFEEWIDHPATYSYTPTADNVNKPAAIWAAVAKKYLA